MARRAMVAAVVVTTGLGLSVTQGERVVAADAPQAVPAPRVIMSDRHDRSPALRAMPRVLPPSSPVREIPNHARPTRRVNPPDGGELLPDPVVQLFAGTAVVP